jgi:hypothetical protein
MALIHPDYKNYHRAVFYTDLLAAITVFVLGVLSIAYPQWGFSLPTQWALVGAGFAYLSIMTLFLSFKTKMHFYKRNFLIDHGHRR